MDEITPIKSINFNFSRETYDDELSFRVANNSGQLDDDIAVNTFLKMVRDWQTIKDEKELRVNNAKGLYLKAIEGIVPTRLDSFPSYLLVLTTELFANLITVPDSRLSGVGIDDNIATVMSKYLEKVVRDGGFHDIMETGWSGYHEAAVSGDIFIIAGFKSKGKLKGMPEYRLKQAIDVYFNSNATRIRVNTSGGEACRYGYVHNFSLSEAERLFPNITDVAHSGDLPISENDIKRDEKTDEQLAVENEKDYIQVGFFADKNFKVTAIIAGSNAVLYKKVEGTKYPYKMKVNGEEQEVINIAQFKFFSKPEGLYGYGLGEAFFNLSNNEGKMFSAQLNNATDNYNAPAIVNIDGVAAADIFEQIAMARRAREEKGESGVLAFDPSRNNGQPIGQSLVSYLRNNFPSQETQPLIDKMEQIVRRFGFNLDFLFTDKDKTLGQTELDIKGTNSTISKIQGNNEAFYRFIYQFAIDTIIKNGNINDKTSFGNDITLDINGENTKVSTVIKETGGGMLTIGEIVNYFKQYKDSLELEINVRSGVMFNDILEERNLLKRLQHLAPGSKEQAKVISALSIIRGGSAVTPDMLTGQEGKQPVAGALAQQLSTEQQV